MGTVMDFMAMIGDAARCDNRPLPVISTDRDTAHFLARQIMNELSPADALTRFDPRVSLPAGVVAMFDGIAIKVAK